MFLKSLEVRGFKSFADKTELEFKKGVTAVVGPNGSGKSNISDSVRWVLGEQSVKSLRGGKMEDVIFAGTQFRKPLGLAQVSITLDNSDGTLQTDYNEVTVTRRIFRSGETEYLINNQKCRLKDITELFMDTGIGKEGYSIIGQGKIDAILSGKAEDRRALLEEAAGIVKYKSRKEEAEKRLDNTDNNLVRIRDIIATYEERLEPLRMEKEKALEYRELAEELRVKEVSLLVHNIEQIKKDYEQVSNQLEEKEKEISAKREILDRFKGNLIALAKEIESLEEKNAKEKDEYYKGREEVNQNEKEVSLFNERVQNFKNMILKVEEEINTLKIKVTDLESAKEELEKKLSSKEEEKNNKLNELNEIDSSINEINNEIRNNEDVLETANKLLRNNINVLERTVNKLNTNDIYECADLIKNCKKAYFMGVGYSGIVAQDSNYKFMRIGINSMYYQDTHTMIMMSALANEGEVVLAISHSGETEEIIKSVKIAKENGAKIIAITENENSTLARVSDINLNYVSSETLLESGAVSSKIAQIFIVDLIYTQVVKEMQIDAVSRKIKTTEAIYK